MTASPATSSQWHAVTPSTRPLSLSILELTPLALTLSLTLASPFASSSTSHLLGGHASGSKRRKRLRKTESDDESTAVEVDEEHRDYASGSTHVPGSWPVEVGRSFKDLLSHGVVVSVNGQPWSRIVAHASDPDPDDSDGDEAEDEWEEDWEVAGGKSDEEGVEEGLGSEGVQRRRPRRARFTLSAQTAIEGPVGRRKDGRRAKFETGRDRAVVVVYGLAAGKEYEIELRVVGMGGAEGDGQVSNSVLIPPSPVTGLHPHPRSRANSIRSRQQPRSRSNSTTTPAQSSENTTPSRRGSPPPTLPTSGELIAPTPVLSAADTQTAQLRHSVSTAAVEKEHLSAQIKEARRASQRAEAALRQEIDAVKKSTEKAGSLDLRAKQKALALQEQVKQGWAGAEAADKETEMVEAGLGEFEAKLNIVMQEVDGVRTQLAKARGVEEDIREQEKRKRAEEEKRLGEVVGKVEKLKMKKERKEAEKIELERRIEDLERQREDAERQAEDDTKRRAGGGYWGNQWDGLHHESGHNRLTTHPSLSNIGAQGGYGAGPAYRPRGAQGYQPRFPSAGAARQATAAHSALSSPTSFQPSASAAAAFRPPPPGLPPAKAQSSAVPAIGNRTISSTSSGVNASAAPFVPSSYTGSSSSSSAVPDPAHHTTLMPPGMQHRIYLPSQSQAGGFQSIRPRPTPTFHPPPSVLAEQAAQAQAKASPTLLSSPAFPPLPSVSDAITKGSKSPAPAAAMAGGPSLASIVTRAVLSPHSSFPIQTAGIGPVPSGPSQAGRRPSPPAGVVLGSGPPGLASPVGHAFSPVHSPVSAPPSLNRSVSPSPNPTPTSSSASSNHHSFAASQSSGPSSHSGFGERAPPYNLSGRVTFAPPPPASSQDQDFPPLSPSGPWSSLNPSIGSRVRRESGDLLSANGPQPYGVGINRSQTPPAGAWGGGGERVGSPLGIGGGSGAGSSPAAVGPGSRKGTE